MGVETMGRVVVVAKIENLSDLFKVNKDLLPRDAVRKVEVVDALVDTGATYLSIPMRYIQQWA